MTRENKALGGALDRLPAAAGGGLIDRRAFLGAAGLAAGAVSLPAQAARIGDDAPPWMKVQGGPFTGYGSPSHHEEQVRRTEFLISGDAAPGSGVSFTPIEHLAGTVTPNGLHFERHHAGIPDIDPDKHMLTIHGLVDRPLKFSVEALLRYPMESRICFVECSGNSFFNTFAEARDLPASTIHGLLSCSEWTGVRLSTLLEETGIAPDAQWLLAEGADAAAMTRSVPMSKALDDAMIALYQNSERIRPEQGYPMRLLLPGWEGNAQIKWLRRIKLTGGPRQTREETSKYSDLDPDGRARQFTFEMAVKSVITAPAPGLTMNGPGFYEISGLAWTGGGRVDRVEISADGGRSWADAALQEPIISRALTRFRIPWAWVGAPTLLMSRATDERGAVQPQRDVWKKKYSPGNIYHYNAIQAWRVSREGAIKNVYA